MVSSAFAYQFEKIVAVKNLEPTCMPAMVQFTAVPAIANCTWIKWYPQGTEAEKRDNINAVFASLLAASVSAKSIRIFGRYDTDGTCTAENIHFNP